MHLLVVAFQFGQAFVTTSSPILRTAGGNPVQNWSLILCLFRVQKCGTLLGLDSKTKSSPKNDPTRRVPTVMARLVVLVSGLSLASPIPDLVAGSPQPHLAYSNSRPRQCNTADLSPSLARKTVVYIYTCKLHKQTSTNKLYCLM